MSRPVLQRGFLIIAAMALIVIVGFLVMALAFIFTGDVTSSGTHAQSAKALFLAETGIEVNTGRLLSPTLPPTLPLTLRRVACTDAALNQIVPPVAYGEGMYTVTVMNLDFTAAGTAPVYATGATLTGAGIDAIVNTIPVDSTTGYASRGRIMIDREIIDYHGIVGNSFVNAVRGMDGSIPVPHVAGTRVGYYQCNLQSRGGVPDFTNIDGQRWLNIGVQLQEGWAVGQRTGNNLTFLRWNRPTQIAWNNASFNVGGVARADLNSVSMLNYADGWAVGDERNGFTIRRWNPAGNTWAASPGIPAPAGDYIQDLRGVSAVSSLEAWAVGVRADDPPGAPQRRYTVLRWNGAGWCLLVPAPAAACSNGITIPADSNANTRDLDAVHVIDTDGNGLGNFGFAVGNNGRALRYTGAAWVEDNPPAGTPRLRGVYVLSAAQVWAVGSNGAIRRWQSGTWTSFASPTGENLNSVYMLDTNGDGLADDGWAVGDEDGNELILRWNGVAWVRFGPGPAPDEPLRSVYCVGVSDCWAVGDNETILHWDGVAWGDQSPSLTGNDLRSVAIIGARLSPQAGWQEDFQ